MNIIKERISLLWAVFALTSCTNSFSDVEGYEDSYPMKFIVETTAYATITTRLSDDDFDNGDKIGLYVMTDDNGLAGSHYIDNQMMLYDDKNLDAGETLYYPDKTTECSFISYYPYSTTKAKSGTSLLPVRVASDQSVDANYYNSDCMVAQTKSKPGDEAIKLNFEHILCQYRIELYTDTKSKYESVLSSSSLSIINTYTSAGYDISDSSFKNLSDKSSIVVNGAWSGEGLTDEGTYKLSGKRVLLIPQDMSNSKFALAIGDEKLICDFPNNVEMVPGNKFSITINIVNGGVATSSITATISPMKDGGSAGSVTMEKAPNYFDISSLDFANTYIYRLYSSDGKLLGELCREYLSADGIDATAIVYYQSSSLQKGCVLKIVGDDDALCGGEVSWADGDVLTYTAGTESKISSLTLDKNGAQVYGYDAAICNNGKAVEYMIEDDRDDSVTKYPVVKIGTQYWMGENLKATRYNDGISIDCNNTNLTTANAGYYTHGTDYFYNTAAVATLKLAPSGWRLPTLAEETLMVNYLKNEAHKLKSVDGWKTVSGVTAGSNLTGFNAAGVGAYTYYPATASIVYDYDESYYCMWLMDDTGQEISDTGMALVAKSNEIKQINQTASLQAYSVRCIRE